MKQICQLCLVSSICFLLTSCGTIESTTDSIVTEFPIIEPTVEPEPTLSPTIEADHFIGEYIDPENDQPGLGLQIQKDEEGYWVEIEVLGKYHVPCCLSELVDGKIEFSAWYKSDFMDGTVTEEDGVATVTFLKDCWDVVSAGDTFIYHKTSDIPYEQYNEWIKNNPSPSPIIKEEDFIGEYFDDIVNAPNLEIQRNEDGTFQVQFEISRVYSIPSCVGKFVDDTIEFTFQDELSKKIMKGTITLEDGYAILTMLSDYWKNIDTKDTYFFYKVSDIPYYSKNNDEMSEE